MKTDDFGNVTLSAQIVYPRRGTGHEPEQEEYKVIFKDKTHINVTGQADHYFIGLPQELKKYELTGFSEPDGLFNRQDLIDDFNTLLDYICCGNVSFELLPP